MAASAVLGAVALGLGLGLLAAGADDGDGGLPARLPAGAPAAGRPAGDVTLVAPGASQLEPAIASLGPSSGAVSDDLAQSPRAPREESEAALYLRYLELGRRGDDALVRQAESALASPWPAPARERVALLRALWDSGTPDAGRWFVSAIDSPNECALAEAAVPDFAVRFLAERAARDPAAARALADAVAAAPPECDAARLARAAAALEENPTSEIRR